MGRYKKINWEEIEILYKRGDRVIDIAKKRGMNPTCITNKANKLGWRHKELKEEIDVRKAIVTTVATARTPATEKMTDKQIENLTKIITSGIDPELQRNSRVLIDKFIDVTNIGLDQAKKIMENAPDGLYTRSEGIKGTSYERTTNFIKDLAPLMQSLNAYIGVSNKENATNVQINNSDKKVNINIIGE